ncbi:MAG: MFS transporter [Betaproteobacteria bacterium]|nr:MFS transporter [Betaproteobacteria bacterium]
MSVVSAPTASRPPTVQDFARIGGLEALCRGCTLSVFPLVMYRAWGSAQLVSQIYFAIGLVSLLTALTVPALTRRFARRRIYLFATALYVVAALAGMVGGLWVNAALLCAVMAAAMSFVCFNAYVLDHIDKADFSKLETLRLFYGGTGWVVGPALGVWLLSVWSGAPFVLLACAATAMGVLICRTPLGEGKFKATAPVLVGGAPRRAHPLAIVRRFFAQPRMVTGWLIPAIRSCAWWLYFVYVGIFAVENGLGEQVGGVASSIANMGLFLAPVMLRWMRSRSVRTAIRAGCLGGSVCFFVATLAAPWPWMTVAALIAGTVFLVLLDTSAGLPFLMSVKPSERTEMSAVYSSFRDVSGIISPGVAWLVLQFFPIAGVFALGGVALLCAWWVAGHIHHELGTPAPLRSRRRRGLS